jgi:carbonic anhydrase
LPPYTHIKPAFFVTHIFIRTLVLVCLSIREKKMKAKLGIISLIAASSMLFATPAFASSGAPWGYEGATGPDKWGSLSHDYEACATGLQQSPIDIPSSAPVNASPIVIKYSPTVLNMINNGHTVQANVDPGSYIMLDGIRYDLLQFHLHDKSEHTFDGKNTDLEIHFVHKNAQGQLAVIGILIKRGAENAAYANIFKNLPAKENDTKKVDGVSLDLGALLPADHANYRYNGSLTTPPCSEGVKWVVMKNMIEVSDAQAKSFEALFKMNNRPTLALGARKFLTDVITLPVSGADADQKIALFEGALIALAGLGIIVFAFRKISKSAG